MTIQGKDPILASRHRFGELMAAAQAAFGMARGEIWTQRGGKPQDVTTNVRNAVHQHHGVAFMRQITAGRLGSPPPCFAERLTAGAIRFACRSRECACGAGTRSA